MYSAARAVEGTRTRASTTGPSPLSINTRDFHFSIVFYLYLFYSILPIYVKVGTVNVMSVSAHTCTDVRMTVQ